MVNYGKWYCNNTETTFLVRVSSDYISTHFNRSAKIKLKRIESQRKLDLTKCFPRTLKALNIGEERKKNQLIVCLSRVILIYIGTQTYKTLVYFPFIFLPRM